MPEKNALAVSYKTAGGEEIKLTPDYVQRFVLTGNGTATDAEIAGFIAKAKAAGANPLAGDAVLQKWGDSPATTIFTEKFFKTVVQSQPDYDGMEHGIIIQNSRGEVERRQGTIYTENERLLGGWCRIFSSKRTHPVDVDVSFGEVVQTRKDGNVNAVWKKQPARMCEKCATTKAAREFCPATLGAAYDQAEMPQEDKAPIQAQDVTAETPEPPQEGQTDGLLAATKEFMRSMSATLARNNGMSPNEAAHAIIDRCGSPDNSREYAQEVTGFVMGQPGPEGDGEVQDDEGWEVA
jgi:phage recombination protein Bet